jgi:hypothetical protein
MALGPTGKVPWIDYNDERIGDSESVPVSSSASPIGLMRASWIG